jgi:hypothetical protein
MAGLPVASADRGDHGSVSLRTHQHLHGAPRHRGRQRPRGTRRDGGLIEEELQALARDDEALEVFRTGGEALGLDDLEAVLLGLRRQVALDGGGDGV